MNTLDLPIDLLGLLANAVKPPGNDSPQEINATVGGQDSKIAWVLEVHNVRNFLAYFPASEAARNLGDGSRRIRW